jgi:leucyl aminopeptidase
MSIDVRLVRRLPDDVELLAVPVAADDPRLAEVHAEEVDSDDSPLDYGYLHRRGFEGKVGQAQSLPGEMDIQVLAVGIGLRDDLSTDQVRRIGATIARHGRRLRVLATTLFDVLPDDFDRVAAAQALAEGASLACYDFSTYKSDPRRSSVERLAVVGTGGKRVQAGLDLGLRIADAVSWARDLVNEPGGSLSARRLGEVAVEMAQREDLQITVLDEDDIVEARLGGLLGVNRGSAEPPRFIQLAFEPTKRARATVALVGKGITFDSGGLSIKTADGMVTMKDDMGGAAAVLGVFSALRAVDPAVRVLGYIPTTDNMIGGDATRPGDVLRIRNGKTVEVLNTDAEGRLVLADALSMAAEDDPDAIIDLATLTGACTIALGNKIAGLMGNNPELIEQVREAAARTGERVWELPLPVDYRRQLNSDIADVKNVGPRFGGALLAGLFLQDFVPETTPWAHIDIAGPAWSGESEGIVTKGGTGFGVRLVLELLRSFSKPS